MSRTLGSFVLELRFGRFQLLGLTSLIPITRLILDSTHPYPVSYETAL